MAELQQQLADRMQNVVDVALDLVPFAMLIADSSGRVIGANRRWTEMSGLDEERSLDSGWLHGLAPDSRLALQAELHRVLAEGGTWTSDHQILSPTKPRWSRWWISRHVVDDTPLAAMAAADVDDDYARQASLYHLATHDSLTGLANRSHFMNAIDQALRRNERQARRVGVVYVDLDGFKKVNDEGGHSLGDRVLLAIGARLRHAVRAADTVARIGGDEFAVLCEGLNAAEQAEIVARRIEQALSESVELDGERWLVPASVGAAVDRGGPDTAENLVDRADRAMYSIKQSRRTVSTPGEPPVYLAAAAPAVGVGEPAAAPPAAEVPAAATGPGVPTAGVASATAPGSPGASSERRQSEGEALTGAAAPTTEVRAAGVSGSRAGEAEAEAAAPATPSATAATAATAPVHSLISPSAQPSQAPEPPLVAGPAPAPPPPTSPSAGIHPPEAASSIEEPARDQLESDVAGLRESLASIRSMLDRLLSPEAPTIDIREREAPDRRP